MFLISTLNIFKQILYKQKLTKLLYLVIYCMNTKKFDNAIIKKNIGHTYFY